MFKRAAALAVAVFALATPVQAGDAGDITRQFLYDGHLGDARTALLPRAAAGDQEARFGLGLVGFVAAVEGFAQALYRHGLAAPNAGPMAPILSVPIPPNAHPQPLDYDEIRAILAALQAGLDAASEELQAAGESGDYVVRLDVTRIRIDVDGDGVANDTETIGNVLTGAFGAPELEAGSSSGAMPEIGFDRADAIWLAGYANVIAAQADFLLAHDFADTVNVAFHLLFPHAGLPMQDYAVDSVGDFFNSEMVDALAAIHTINWPVVEPDRLRRVLDRFQKVIDLSRRNWDAILAETDNDGELVPGPKQTALVPGSSGITEEQVAAWRATLDTAEEIIEGRLLVPHWRFSKGFDLNAYFATATRTDLVMILTGYGALPFLKDGPIASAASFAEANRVFGDDLIGYAFWFN